MTNLRGLGNLAKILEEAAKPDSALREDREKPKPKVLKKGEKQPKVRVIDPKRKLWYEKRLKESLGKEAPAGETAPAAAGPLTPLPVPTMTRTAASMVGGSLLQSLAAAKDAKPKADGPKRSEAWRRKPGESLF